MKNNNLDQVIKDSLEQLNPEVPAHLWENIRANIPAANPAGSTSGVEQGTAGSAATGASGLLKLGIAAAVLIGGGILVWQLNTNPEPIAEQYSIPVIENQETPELQEPELPTADFSTGEEESQEEPVNRESERTLTDESPDSEITPEHETAPIEEPSNDVAEEVTPQTTEDSDESVDIAEEPTANSSTDVPSDEPESAKTTVAEDSQKEGSSEEIVPEPVPVPYVEAGILADEVSGEVPMIVKFENTTEAKSYEWDFGNGRRSTEAAPEIEYDEEGEYTVELTVIDFEGNRISDQMQISVFPKSTLFVPNTITPNGDGKNDYFLVIGTNVSDVKFYIYRLDGSLVFEGKGLEARWDGHDPQGSQNGMYNVVATAIAASGELVIETESLQVQ